MGLRYIVGRYLDKDGPVAVIDSEAVPASERTEGDSDPTRGAPDRPRRNWMELLPRLIGIAAGSAVLVAAVGTPAVTAQLVRFGLPLTSAAPQQSLRAGLFPTAVLVIMLATIFGIARAVDWGQRHHVAVYIATSVLSVAGAFIVLPVVIAIGVGLYYWPIVGGSALWSVSSVAGVPGPLVVQSVVLAISFSSVVLFAVFLPVPPNLSISLKTQLERLAQTGREREREATRWASRVVWARAAEYAAASLKRLNARAETHRRRDDIAQDNEWDNWTEFQQQQLQTAMLREDAHDSDEGLDLLAIKSLLGDVFYAVFIPAVVWFTLVSYDDILTRIHVWEDVIDRRLTVWISLASLAVVLLIFPMLRVFAASERGVKIPIIVTIQASLYALLIYGIFAYSYATFLYPGLPQYFGGGEAMPARMWVSDGGGGLVLDRSLPRGACVLSSGFWQCSNVFIVTELSDALAVSDTGTPDGNSVILSRSAVTAISQR